MPISSLDTECSCKVSFKFGQNLSCQEIPLVYGWKNPKRLFGEHYKSIKLSMVKSYQKSINLLDEVW